MLYCNICWFRDAPAVRCGAPVGMKWFRSNIKHGSRLALLALALQFGLSFGHFHADAAQAAPPAVQSVTAPSDTSAVTPDAVSTSALPPASHDDSDHHPGKDCALCA